VAGKFKTGLLGCSIIFIAFIVFAVIFPMVHQTEVLDPSSIETGGDFIELDSGTTIHYREKGRGETLLLIHGFTSSSYTWLGVMPELSRHYHVLAPDVVGFGLSDKPPDAPYNYSYFAETINEFLDKKGVGKVSVAGNSMGGGIAIRYALDHPGRVKKLILVSSSGVEHGGTHWMFKIMATPGVNSFVSSINNRFIVARLLKRTCFYDPEVVTREKAEAYMLPFRTKGAMGAAAATMANNDWASLETGLNRLRMPVFIVWGDKDRLIYPAIAHKFHNLIPGSELRVIEKCGHMPQEEKPELTAEIFLDFLTGDDGS